MSHKDWEKITFNDFKGLKRPNMTLDGESKFAFISTSIRMRKNKDKAHVEALFHPSRSYVYSKNLYSDNLLTHEMYHFHITEYCARLIRRDIKKMADSGKSVDLKNIKKRMLTKERKLQALYDDETYHSYVHGKQIEWQKKIDSLLLTVEEYKHSTITFNYQ